MRPFFLVTSDLLPFFLARFLPLDRTQVVTCIYEEILVRISITGRKLVYIDVQRVQYSRARVLSPFFKITLFVRIRLRVGGT